MDKLLQNIAKYIPVSQPLENALVSSFQFTPIQQGTLLLREGQYNVSLFFIQSGIVRCFNRKEEKEITNDFFFENTFVTDFPALLNNTPASQNFEAIENTSIYTFSRDKLIRLTVQFPELRTWGGKMAELLFAQSIKKQSALKSDSPKERYLAILKEKPQIIQRIPLFLIASYLGITQVHLSRIRKDLKM